MLLALTLLHINYKTAKFVFGFIAGENFLLLAVFANVFRFHPRVKTCRSSLKVNLFKFNLNIWQQLSQSLNIRSLQKLDFVS
jgi:hypothetical protein